MGNDFEIGIMSRIHDKALLLHGGDKSKSNEWMVSPNSIFGGGSPLSYCKPLEGALTVEDYLDERISRLNIPKQSFSERYQEIKGIANKVFTDSRMLDSWLYSKSIPHFEGDRPIDLIRKSEDGAERVRFALKVIMENSKLK